MKQQPSQLRQKCKKYNKDIVLVELDMKCSCPQSISKGDAAIQFTRRYLRCQRLMPIRAIRLFIEAILPCSPSTKVFIYDTNDRLLKDSDRLRSLIPKHISSPSTYYVVLRFTLLNSITWFANCSCLSSPIEQDSSSSFVSKTIEQEKINDILSTLSISPTTTTTTTLVSNSTSSTLSLPLPNVFHNPIEHSCVQNQNPKLFGLNLDASLINKIMLEYGEICPKTIKRKRYHETSTVIPELPLDIPLDLRIKKHS